MTKCTKKTRFLTHKKSQKKPKSGNFGLTRYIIHLGFSAVFQTLGGGFKLWFIFVLPILVCLQSHLQYNTLPMSHSTKHDTRCVRHESSGFKCFFVHRDPCGNDCQIWLVQFFFQMGRKNNHQLEKNETHLQRQLKQNDTPRQPEEELVTKMGGEMSSLPGWFPS